MKVVDRLAAPAPDVGDQPIAVVGDAARPGEIGRRPRRAARASARRSPSGRPPSAMWRLGMSRMWVGARGAMSRMAMTSSSSWTRSDGISPATMRQNRQSAGHRPLLVAAGHHSTGFELIRKPIVPDQPGHQVRHVALPAGPREPGLVVGRGPDADQPPQVGPLDEERDPEVDEVDRQRDEQPRLLEHRRTERRRSGRCRSAQGPRRWRGCRGSAPRAASARPGSPIRWSRGASEGRRAAGSRAGRGSPPG